MTDSNVLTQLEHYLLGRVANGEEPLWIVYRESMMRWPETSHVEFASALERLSKLGFVTEFSPRDKLFLTAERLLHHFENRSEEQLKEHSDSELWIEVTDKGLTEYLKPRYKPDAKS